MQFPRKLIKTHNPKYVSYIIRAIIKLLPILAI